MAVPVVVVDDHRMVGVPLVAALTPALAAHGFRVLPLAVTVAAVGRTTAPGVAVCDVILDGGVSGAAAVEALAGRGWRVLLMSGAAPEEQVLDAVAAGARGYLVKSDDPGSLVAAILAVAATGRHLSPSLAALLYADLGRRPEPRLSATDQRVLRSFVQGEDAERAAASCGLTEPEVLAGVERIFRAAVERRRRHQLTPRELEVVRAVACEHLSTAEAARRLFMSIDTANTHLRSIRRKYRLVHPDAPATLPQRTAAQLWARELNLC
ncbi:hypothetical protein GCM10010399_86610 [Dactylosporangium fulvum]|uniref:Response regulatory domain-containing protein n=1 Tax=Dactylosporangium fulvum TaxID=53359 RepID=A0ABY5W7Q7_9ACTN|nr:response regulator [Dactylosporangium fulvum]UWP85049.1 hypothetical protein Dfulv_12795 [Dactylosporangium fulvum]